MSVLITGNDTRVMKSIASKLSLYSKVIIVGTMNYSDLDSSIRPFSFTPCDEMFEKLFQSYQFETVIFVTSRHMRAGGNSRGEQDDLRRVLQLAYQEKSEQVICISSTIVYANYSTTGSVSDISKLKSEGQDIKSESGTISEKASLGSMNELSDPEPADIGGILLASSEQLCKYYRVNHNLNTVILRVPYLYGDEGSDLITEDLLRDYMDNKSITLPGESEDYCDFVSEADLSDLLHRMVDDPYSLDSGVMHIGSNSPFQFKVLAEDIKKLFPSARVRLAQKRVEYPVPVMVETARLQYDWITLDDFFSTFSARLENYMGIIPKKIRWWDRASNFIRNHQVLIRGIELILGYVVVEFLHGITKTTAQYHFVDFRLLYIVIFGGIYGMRSGVFAAVLASTSYLTAYLQADINWEILFYNIENWLPLVAYFIAGGVIGHSKDMSINKEYLMKNQQNTLEERYLFLYELYDQTLANKNIFKEQIIGYRDSFGRIYDTVRKLESVEQEEIFLKATQVLEDILESKSVAIYMVDHSNQYARLTTSSNAIIDKIDKSLMLVNHPEMLEKLHCNEIWCNVSLNRKDPMYCSAITDEGKIVALIVLWEAEFTQMSASYLNLFKVLSGLIEASIIRAVKYNALVGGTKYLPDTQILKSNEFTQLLNIKILMMENNIAKYKLLRVDMLVEDPVWLSNTVLSCIRETDTMGQLEGKGYYILLSQADDSNVGLMIERLEHKGVKCSIEKG